MGITADESVEVFETQACRPKIEGPGLTGMPIRHIVVLAVPCCVVAILLQDFGKRPATFRHQRVVAREFVSSLISGYVGDISMVTSLIFPVNANGAWS